MKMINIDEENLHIFRTTWENSKKCSGNMCRMIILKVTKIQGFSLSLESTVLGNMKMRKDLGNEKILWKLQNWVHT